MSGVCFAVERVDSDGRGDPVYAATRLLNGIEGDCDTQRVTNSTHTSGVGRTVHRLIVYACPTNLPIRYAVTCRRRRKVVASPISAEVFGSE